MDSPQSTPRLASTLVLALGGVTLMLMLQALPAWLPALEYRRDLLTVEPWRLITGHLVHVNWKHAFFNGAAWLVLAHLFNPQLDARRQLLCLLAGGVFISVGLATYYPAIAWYRGASGSLHALYFAGACVTLVSAVRAQDRSAALVALALLAGGWIKIAVERPGSAELPFAEWLGTATVPQAHLLGAAFGTAMGLLLAARRPADPTVSL